MPRSQTPLPHRLPSSHDEHPTPLLPPGERPIECPKCEGEGKCRACGGTGRIVSGDDDVEVDQPCTECDERGDCHTCDGEGHVTRAKLAIEGT